MNRKGGESSGSSRTKIKVNTKAGSDATSARAIKDRPKTAARSQTRARTQAKSRANTHAPQRMKKSGGYLAYIIVTLLTFGVIISDMAGPFKDWMRPVKPVEVKSANVEVEPKKEIPKPVKKLSLKKEKTDKVFKASISKNIQAEEVEEADEEKLKKARYEEIYQDLSSKIKTPVLKKRVTIKMKDGKKLNCHVISIGKRSLSLEKIEPYNGKMNLDVAKLSDETRRLYFGEQYARMKARKMVEREEQQGFFKKDPATESGFFDPSIEETPKRLVHAVQEVGDWLKFQARRGSESSVVRMGAKKNGQACILYIYLDRGFFSQTIPEKTQWLEAVRQFWAMRCKSNSLATEENAHICLVMDGRNIVVGGTKEENAKKIWLKKTRR
ncbi:hypothetical protein PQO03_02305 [Lentisphaera profundi]|uniref:TNase-like domain-containing protein n=1 Tax=Lentisphaera profundi TaxID=1658616 RepID=A0ABY7VV81_9BACT|nr:hypothetical protein [Lentisphaera profundi]WDE96792.1 hypothetical protein PQO03_02305 [Lentisphaera profundi]